MKINISLILFLLLLSVNLAAQDEFTIVKEGQKAPEFTYENSEGVTAKLSDLNGKVVWITFFATWCGPCRKELPYLEKQVYERFKNHPDFKLLVIGREHTWEDLNKFRKDTGHNLPFVPDPKREIYSKYAAQNIPRNVIINKAGVIKVSSVGFNLDDFHGKIKKAEELINFPLH
jgi:peroxiredoxin